MELKELQCRHTRSCFGQKGGKGSSAVQGKGRDELSA